MKIIKKKFCIFVWLDTCLKFGKRRQTSFFFSSMVFFSLSFAIYFVFNFLSSIFNFLKRLFYCIFLFCFIFKYIYFICFHFFSIFKCFKKVSNCLSVFLFFFLAFSLKKYIFVLFFSFLLQLCFILFIC